MRICRQVMLTGLGGGWMAARRPGEGAVGCYEPQTMPSTIAAIKASDRTAAAN